MTADSRPEMSMQKPAARSGQYPAESTISIGSCAMELERRGYRCMTPKGSTSPILTFIYPSTSKLGPRLEAAQVEIALLDNCFRISPSVFNDLNDIERLIDALPQGAGSGGEIQKRSSATR